jgi:UDP-N-acetylglucosamine:LPS N-acetylglucosamine transferase
VKTIDLVYFNAGGGHRAAATALEQIIREQQRPWRIRLVNLFEVLDPRDLFRKTTGMNHEDFYNVRLARGWTLGLRQELKVLQAFIRLGHNSLTKQLRAHWRRTRPDMVVSLVPNFNRAMYQAISEALPGVPYVTVMTDLADYPPHFWIEPCQRQHLVCGTPRAVAQARAMGYSKARIHATSGMIIRPEFYRDLNIDRRSEMQKHKLDPKQPTGIVMFGGHGSRVMERIAKRLDDVQLILICGHNSALADELRAMNASAPRLVLGFTPDISYYMRLGDFFIGKPGPGSLSEAVHHGLPVIVVRNAWTMPQERYNTEWVKLNRAGIVLDSFSLAAKGVEEMTARLDEFRTHVGRIKNRAVFEVPEILERILSMDERDRFASREAVALGLH